MVTRNELLEDDKRRAVDAKKEEEKYKKEQEAYRLEKNEADKEYAKSLVNGKLGCLIKGVNRLGDKELEISNDYNRYNVCDENNREQSEHFKLDFVPKPDYEATKLLLRRLHRAGFKASLKEEEVPNYEIDPHGASDGGPSSVRVPGYSIKHCILISW